MKLSGVVPPFQANTFDMSDFSLPLPSSTQDFRYWSEQGETLLNLNQYESALNCFEQAIALHPNDPELMVFKGVAFIHLKRYEAALAALNQALQLSPQHAEALVFRGAALNYLGRYSECYESYQQAIESSRLKTCEATSKPDRLSQVVANLYTRFMSAHTP